VQAATCDVCEMPPRLKNRNISTHEVLILEMEAQIAGDLRRAILSEARGVMATRPLGMNGKHYWIRFSKLLLRRHYQRIRDTFFGQERNWENIARSWIRRTIEMRNNNQLLELIASKMEDIPCGKRPDNWSQRPSIRCAVCVVEAIQSGRDSKWCTVPKTMLVANFVYSLVLYHNWLASAITWNGTTLTWGAKGSA